LKPNVYHIIDLILVNIIKAYGLLLSRDWSQNTKSYFTYDWSHLFLSSNRRPSKIKINHERYLKHIVTNLEAYNEPFSSKFPFFWNCARDSHLGNFFAKSLLIPDNQQSEIMLQENIFQETQFHIIDVNSIDKTNLAIGSKI
jgi:hypothetical protein